MGEGPIWDYEKKLLYWIDINKKEIHIFNPLTSTERIIKTSQMIGAIVPRKTGGVVLALENGFYFLDEETEKLTFIADPESDIPENRFNDGKCDPAGRFWAGTMSKSEKKGAGSLYCLNTDLSVSNKLEGVSISNGIVWSLDKRKMYYIDSLAKEVWGFDYEAETGNISNKRIAVTIPEGEGFPDGMAIDSEDMIWVALWNGWKVSRWNPETGKKLGEIKLPVAQVTACAFGGADLDELFITTASKGLSEEELEKQPQAGGLFCVKLDVKGLPAFKFEG
ncbi:MAG: SMP-30/gluconolactonase/LRE family protein [Clostridiales bacterium]|nr:SMP-30/gluconolactonase/LRE family protein [Clostridiales bacterium]